MSTEQCQVCVRIGTGFCKTCKVEFDLCCGDDYFLPRPDAACKHKGHSGICYLPELGCPLCADVDKSRNGPCILHITTGDNAE